jgi:tRNA(Arg) A34 adenosine deaminase TadA
MTAKHDFKKEKRGDDKRFMHLAIEDGLRGIKKGDGGPFGACVARNGKIVALAHNTVLKTKDPTCHAEINAIRRASKKLGRWNLSECVIYSTTEPCPMCFSAIHWARIDEVIFGVGIPDVARLGFNELLIRADSMKKSGGSKVKIKSGFMREECLQLLGEWKKLNLELY